MKTIINPFVTLVGAGPGDPELFTLGGRNALMSAKAVLYDALVSPELLKYAPTAKKVFVGKRKGFKRYSQEEINQLIVDYAHSHGNVVRLKGGDPFVFGRGAEELESVIQNGIPYKVIPGITSATSVPTRLGISLTKRGISQSFWTITGTTSHHQLSNDIYLASQSSATVVILMGVSKLPEIVSIYKRLDKHDLPVAIIQSGYMKEENRVVGTINTIEEKSRLAQISNPAIIVIGDVVDDRLEVKQKTELNALFTY